MKERKIAYAWADEEPFYEGYIVLDSKITEQSIPIVVYARNPKTHRKERAYIGDITINSKGEFILKNLKHIKFILDPKEGLLSIWRKLTRGRPIQKDKAFVSKC